MLGKRYAADISSHVEACLTEYYRQECLRSLYKKQERRDLWEYPMQHHTITKQDVRKGVSFAMEAEIIGCADPSIDRSPIDVSPISQLELLLLLSQRTFPVQA
ncbi:hypothetical protein FI667_g1026, partial [Globisporangium splendens]